MPYINKDTQYLPSSKSLVFIWYCILLFLVGAVPNLSYSEDSNLTVCIDYPDVALTRWQVLCAFQNVLSPFLGSRVTRVIFEDKNSIMSATWGHNRWLVTFNTEFAFEYVCTRGLNILGKHITCKPYEEVMYNDNYREYSKYSQLSSNVNTTYSQPHQEP